MSSLDALRTRHYAAKGVAQRVADDTPAAIRMRYIGTGTVTSVTIVTGTSLATITSDGGTDTFLFATYTTIGTLVAAINALGIFEAHALSSLLADSTTGANYFVNGALVATTDDNGIPCYDILWDTSIKQAYTVALSQYRNFNPIRKGIGHRFHIQGLNYFADVSAAEAGAVRIYQRKDSVEKLIWSNVSVDTTDTAITFAGGHGKISGDEGAELIARVMDTTSLTNHASGYLQVTGIYE
jgi:uncharacterized membrane protein (UPF0136 family)